MKRILSTLITLVISLHIAWGEGSTTESWAPTPSWPFVYAEFQKCIVHTNSGKTINVIGNIHIGNHYLWYQSSNGKTLQAKKGTVKDLCFADASKYIEHEGKLLKIISEDTVNAKVFKLMQSFEVDRLQYNEIFQNKRKAENCSLLDISGLNEINLDVSVRESSNLIEQDPLPTKNIFYIMAGDDIFEARESNILKHLANKEERTAYRAYTRKAEIITGDINSIINIYTTFFVKK